jgi:hypothetical protein
MLPYGQAPTFSSLTGVHLEKLFILQSYILFKY